MGRTRHGQRWDELIWQALSELKPKATAREAWLFKFSPEQGRRSDMRKRKFRTPSNLATACWLPPSPAAYGWR